MENKYLVLIKEVRYADMYVNAKKSNEALDKVKRVINSADKDQLSNIFRDKPIYVYKVAKSEEN